jgi:hypothetical protein
MLLLFLPPLQPTLTAAASSDPPHAACPPNPLFLLFLLSLPFSRHLSWPQRSRPSHPTMLETRVSEAQRTGPGFAWPPSALVPALPQEEEDEGPERYIPVESAFLGERPPYPALCPPLSDPVNLIRRAGNRGILICWSCCLFPVADSSVGLGRCRMRSSAL